VRCISKLAIQTLSVSSLFKLAGNWPQVWNRVKLFFVVLFYLILTGMYSVHSFKATKQLVKFYNNENPQHTINNKQKEEIMNKSGIETSTSKTKDNFISPASHLYI
jgi:hypothetical protein